MKKYHPTNHLESLTLAALESVYPNDLQNHDFEGVPIAWTFETFNEQNMKVLTAPVGKSKFFQKLTVKKLHIKSQRGPKTAKPATVASPKAKASPGNAKAKAKGKERTLDKRKAGKESKEKDMEQEIGETIKSLDGTEERTLTFLDAVLKATTDVVSPLTAEAVNDKVVKQGMVVMFSLAFQGKVTGGVTIKGVRENRLSKVFKHTFDQVLHAHKQELKGLSTSDLDNADAAMAVLDAADAAHDADMDTSQSVEVNAAKLPAVEEALMIHLQDSSFVCPLVDFVRENSTKPIAIRLQPLYTNLVSKVMNSLQENEMIAVASVSMPPPKTIGAIIGSCSSLVGLIPEQWAIFMTLVSKLVRLSPMASTVGIDEAVAGLSKGIFDRGDMFERTRALRSSLVLEVVRSTCCGADKMTAADLTPVVELLSESEVLMEVSKWDLWVGTMGPSPWTMFWICVLEHLTLSAGNKNDAVDGSWS